MKLYDYYRSTASYRVRIGLNVKKLDVEQVSVHLVRDGGEQHMAPYRAINPQGLVPALELEDKSIITQSFAILEYLEEVYPSPALLPTDAFARSTVRSLAQLIACDMHPLNNLRVLQQLKAQFNADEVQVHTWYHHWLKLGFDAFEQRLESTPNRSEHFCYGDKITFADICLIPQLYNARRFEFALDAYPIIQSIEAHCLTLDAFAKASPKT